MAIGAEAEPDTGALVALIISGHAAGHPAGPARAAEETLCRRFAPRIRLYGLRHLRETELVRDLVQIVLLAVLQAVRAGKVREPEHLERFILGTCRNTAMRLRHKEQRSQPTESGELEAMLVAPEPTESLDGGKALDGCLERLELRARRVVTLAFRDEKSADEIATALKTTAGNVRVIRHRALAALRLCLDGKQESSASL